MRKAVFDVITQTICPIADTLCALAGVILGVIGIKVSLPKISKQMSEISQKIIKPRFDLCASCPFQSACTSPTLPDTGDFEKANAIDDHAVKDGIIRLYDEIKNYVFDEKAVILASNNHKECLLRKLTMAMNLIVNVTISFNSAKDHIKKTRTGCSKQNL